MKFLIMATTKNKPNIVKLMREIRNQFSLEIIDMSLEEEKAYIKKQMRELKQKRRISVS